MGHKTVVNKEILEVLDNEGLPLGMLLLTSEDIELSIIELDNIVQSINPLDVDLSTIRRIREDIRKVKVHSKYVQEKLKMYLN
jgi:hypothetical protein